MVLPSNAAPLIYPDNDCSHFITNINPPIFFDDSWKVGLTELNFYRSMLTASQGSGYIETRKRHTEHVEEINLSGPVENVYGQKFGSFEIKNVDDRLVIISEKTKFRLEISSKEDYVACGFWGGDTTNPNYLKKFSDHHGAGGHQLISDVKPPGHKWVQDLTLPQPDHPPPPPTFKETKLMIYWYTETIFTNVHTFEYDFICHNVEELSERITDDLRGDFIFKDGRFKLPSFEGGINIRFTNGFHFVMGYAKEVMTAAELLKGPADYAPQLKRGISGMYIYSNICKNMQVGDSLSPLLRHIVVPPKEDTLPGTIEKIIMDYPMYVSIGISAINSLELEIRTNKGDYFPFSPGSVTTLTLHFKKNG